MEAAARATAPGDPGGTPRQPVAAAVIAAGFYFEKSPIIETRATRSGVRHGRHGCADHGSVRSMNWWKDGKETGDRKITVTSGVPRTLERLPFAAWAAFLGGGSKPSARSCAPANFEVEVIDPIAGARVRARRKWPVSGESGRVHDPIATRPKHDLQRDR